MAKKKTSKKKSNSTKSDSGNAKYPKYSLEKALRIPKAIMDQNAGKSCTDKEAAGFIGVSSSSGPFRTELSAALKFNLLSRLQSGTVELTEISKKIFRPENSNDVNEGYQQAIIAAPQVSDVYKHFRGENLPDEPFFTNSLSANFGIPVNKIAEFKEILLSSLKFAHLVEEHNDKIRVLDVLKGPIEEVDKSDRLKKLEKGIKISDDDTCFVMMPFASPIGDYYSLIYEPAIRKAGLKAIRADDDIFKTGKIMDQVWSGISSAKVLVAELTGRNPNVFYELGLAHAKQKPVVLVASTDVDVPFDIRHIRVIYYDVNDPFWGQKLIEKVAENVLSALKNPREATFRGNLENGE